VTGREGDDAEKDLKESQTSIDWFCPPDVVRLSNSFWFRRRVSLRARGEQRRRGGDRNGTAAEKLRQFVFQATYIVDNRIRITTLELLRCDFRRQDLERNFKNPETVSIS
jgi:hypothetical protein